MLPELPIFDPWVTIRVGEASRGWARSSGSSGSSGGGSVTPIADCRIPLGKKLPWLFSEADWESAVPSDSFVEASLEARAALTLALRKEQLKAKLGTVSVIKPPEQAEEDLDTTGVHLKLRTPANRLEKNIPFGERNLNMKLGHAHGRPAADYVVRINMLLCGERGTRRVWVSVCGDEL